MFYYYWDRGDSESGVQKLVRAAYETLDEAKAQFNHDKELGIAVVRIEEEPADGSKPIYWHP